MQWKISSFYSVRNRKRLRQRSSWRIRNFDESTLRLQRRKRLSSESHSKARRNTSTLLLQRNSLLEMKVCFLHHKTRILDIKLFSLSKTEFDKLLSKTKVNLEKATSQLTEKSFQRKLRSKRTARLFQLTAIYILTKNEKTILSAYTTWKNPKSHFLQLRQSDCQAKKMISTLQNQSRNPIPTQLIFKKSTFLKQTSLKYGRWTSISSENEFRHQVSLLKNCTHPVKSIIKLTTNSLSFKKKKNSMRASRKSLSCWDKSKSQKLESDLTQNWTRSSSTSQI